MSHHTTKNIIIALLCSVALHSMIAFAPRHNEHALINNNLGTSQFKLTLARQTPEATSVLAPLKNEETKQQIDKIPESQKPPREVKKPVEYLISKSASPNKATPSTEVKKEVAQSSPAKKQEAEEIAEQQPSPTVGPSEPLTIGNRSEGPDSSTELPAESMDSNLMKGWQSDLVQRINRQKRYPRQALRRGIEGDVKVKAMIHPDGTLATAEILSGNKQFKASSLQAISRALPFPPPVAVSTPITVSFIIHYTIN